MPIFLVHYELQQKPDVEYPHLIPTLTKFDARRLSASAWALRSDKAITELRDEIQISALPGDRFVIAEISDWRSSGTISRIDDI